jgi:hypothetical protein
VPADAGDRPSPYAGGFFTAEVHLPPNYPQDAPEVAFITKVWHPQVDYETGKPCVDFLREQWRPAMGLRDVLVMLRQLLASPSAGTGFALSLASHLFFSKAQFLLLPLRIEQLITLMPRRLEKFLMALQVLRLMPVQTQRSLRSKIELVVQ